MEDHLVLFDFNSEYEMMVNLRFMDEYISVNYLYMWMFNGLIMYCIINSQCEGLGHYI